MKSRDFKNLAIFGDFPAISRKILAIFAIFEPFLASEKLDYLAFFSPWFHAFQKLALIFKKNYLEKILKFFWKMLIFEIIVT